MTSRLDVSIDLGGLESMFSDAAMEAAQDEMSRRWRDLMEPYVPKDNGDLRSNVSVDGEEITYAEDYAACVYNMDGDVNWSTGGTGAHWNELAKADGRAAELAEHVGRVIAGGAR